MLLRAVAFLGVVLAASTAQAPEAPDLILHNGNIVTVDARFALAEAIAVKGDAIVAVGSNGTVRRLTTPSTRLIDLRGRTVVPGLMDNHLHSAGGGPGVDLSRTRALPEVLAAVATRVKASAPGDIVLSNSDWHEAQLREQRLPLRDDLDTVAPTTPVVLVRGGHEYILNSAALARWKITEETAAPEGGRISRYPGGRLNGELVDRAKDLVALPRVPPKTLEERIRDRAAEYATLNAAGLTTVRHPGISLDDYRLLQEMARRGALTMRVHALLRPAGDLTSVQLDEGNDRLRLSGIKLAVDGGFEGGLMRDLYAKPFDEDGTFRGLQTVKTAAFIQTVRDLNRRGWRIATHAVGDAAIDLVLGAYEAANADRTIAGRRWSIEHAFIGRPDHLPRLKALDVAISAQNHLYLAGPSLVKYWGADRAALTTPVRRYLDAGLLVSSGTDAAVVPFPPLWTIYHFITRDTLSGGVMGPDQRITRQEALQLATINNARLMGDESRKGSIETGKLADLVVLSENILTCPESRIRDADVLMTIVGGKIVYEKTNAAPTAARPGGDAAGTAARFRANAGS
jgi:predicted amidohydrolase YtcJ